MTTNTRPCRFNTFIAAVMAAAGLLMTLYIAWCMGGLMTRWFARPY